MIVLFIYFKLQFDQGMQLGDLYQFSDQTIRIKRKFISVDREEGIIKMMNCDLNFDWKSIFATRFYYREIISMFE
jgi:hypothetical protein